MKLLKKSLAPVLSIIMIIGAVPISSFSVEAKNSKAVEKTKKDTVDTEKLKVISEVEEKRDEFTKVFELEDGSFYEIQSSSPIHTKKLGKWVDAKDVAQPTQVKNIMNVVDELTDAVAAKKGSSQSSLRTLTDNDIEEDEHTHFSVAFAKTSANDDEVISNSCAMLLQDDDIPFGTETPLGYTNELTLSYTVTLELSEPDAANKVFVYPVNSDWSNVASPVFSNFDYRNQPNVDIADIQKVTLEGNYEFDATNIYNDWLIGARANYGLAFIGNTSDPIEIIGDVYQMRLYKDMSLINTDSTYHSIDAGLAGTIYIDDYSNVATLARDEMGMPNNTMPVAIERWVSPISLGESSCYGDNSYINYHSYVTNANQEYTWYSVGGNAVRFVVTNTSEPVTDVDGLGYTINVADKTITDNNGTVYQFNSAFYLTSITDSYQNKIKISYSTTNGIRRISYVEEEANERRYSFTYSNIAFTVNNQTFNKRLLTSITLKQGTLLGYSTVQLGGEAAVINYEYMALSDSLVVLKKATYPDNSEVTYSYNSDGTLKTVVDADGRKITLNYSDNIKHFNLYNTDTVSSTNINRSESVLVGYTEQKVNTNNTATYDTISKLTIDNHSQLRRGFKDLSGKTVVSKFNSFLKPDFYIDESGCTYVFDYESNPQTVTAIKKHTDTNNLITNGRFDNGSGTYSENSWFCDEDCYSVSMNYEDTLSNGVLKIDSDGSTDNRAFTVIDLTNTGSEIDENTVFVLDCDAYVNTANENAGNFAGIKVYPCEDAEGSNPGSEIYSMSFESGFTYRKQHKCGYFSLGNIDSDYLKVEILYTGQFNDAYFDNVSLIVDDSNIVETSNLNDPVDTFAPQEYFEKNSHGLTTEHILFDGSEIVAERFSYGSSAPFNTTSTTDFNNAVVSYTYSDTTGLLSSKEKGNKKSVYTYNPLGLLSSVETVEANVQNNPLSVVNAFDYHYNKISSVEHGTTTYSFEYDTDGKVVSVNRVDSSNNSDTDLMQANYNAADQNRIINFANGDSLKYHFDVAGKVNSVSFKGAEENAYTSLASYYYDATLSHSLKRIYDKQTDKLFHFNGNGVYKIVDLNHSNGLPQIEVGEGSETHLEDSLYNYDPLPALNAYSFAQTSENSTSEELYDWEVTTIKNKEYTSNNKQIFSSSSSYKLDEMEFTVPNGQSPYYYQGETMSGKLDMNTSTAKDKFGRTASSGYVYTLPGSNVEHSLNNSYSYKSREYHPSIGSMVDYDEATSYLPSSYSTATSTQNEDASIDMIYSYEYNDLGYVTKVTMKNRNTHQVNNQLPIGISIVLYYYEYDNIGQLVSQYDYSSASLIHYEYDANGNITKKTIKPINTANVSFNDNGMVYTFPTTYSFETIEFTYNNFNQLTTITTQDYEHSGGGNVAVGNPVTKTMTYDENGNTTHYVIGNKEYNLEWDGYKLKRCTAANGDSWTDYFYDDADHLIEKRAIHKVNVEIGNNEYELRTLNKYTIKYIWQGDKITGLEYRLFNDDNVITSITTVKYIFDDEGNMIGALPHFKAKSDGNLSPNPTPSEDNGYNCLSSNKPIWFTYDGIGNVVGMYQDGQSLASIHTYNANGEIGNTEMYGSYFSELETYFLSQGTPAWAIPIAMVMAMGTVSHELSVCNPLGYQGGLYDQESGFIFTNGRVYSPYLSRYVDADPSYMTDSNYLQSTYITNVYTYASNNPANIDGNNQYIFDKTSPAYADIKSTLWMKSYFG